MIMISGASFEGGAADAADAEDADFDEDELLPEDGHEFVFADAVADFDFPFQMENEDRDLTVNAVADFEDSDGLQVESVVDIDVPLNERVSGVVSELGSRDERGHKRMENYDRASSRDQFGFRGFQFVQARTCWVHGVAFISYMRIGAVS